MDDPDSDANPAPLQKRLFFSVPVMCCGSGLSLPIMQA